MTVHTEPHTEQGFSLDRIYDIPLEARRLRESFPPPADMGRFLHGEATNFLLEHAGYVPFSEVEGELTVEGRYMMQGLDMEESWQRAISRYGVGSREHHETMGYQEALKRLRNPEVGMVALSSPSKEGFADRRFTFTMVKVPNEDGSYRVIQTNIMHRHDDVSFDQAKSQYGELQDVDGYMGERTEPGSTQDMLTKPLSFQHGTDRETVFSMLGLSAAKIAESREYEKRVQSELGHVITFFIHIMTSLSHIDPETNPEEYARLVSDAKDCRDFLFEKATELREKFVEEVACPTNGDIGAMVQTHFEGGRERPLFYGTLVCDTQTTLDYAGLIAQGYSPSEAAYYTTQMAPSVKEEWRDKNRWPKGNCRERGKGGCGSKDVKVGPCHVCEKCQDLYDKGKTP